MLLVSALFWHAGVKDRKLQWQCVRKANTGEATVCVWFVLTSQVKQVSSDGKQFDSNHRASNSCNMNIYIYMYNSSLGV